MEECGRVVHNIDYLYFHVETTRTPVTIDVASEITSSLFNLYLRFVCLARSEVPFLKTTGSCCPKRQIHMWLLFL